MPRRQHIGLPLATLLVAGNMIGSGIYLLPASLARIGSITLIGWMLATIGALLIAAVLSHLGRMSPLAGGLCSYADEALGPYVGFQANIFYWTCAWIGNIAIALAAVGYLGALIPWFGQHTALGVIALIWVATAINIFGPRFACQVQSTALVVGLIPILLVALGGWFWFHPGTFFAGWNVSGQSATSSISGSLVLVFWAFVGLESASLGTAIVENPKRNVPLATYLGVLLAAVVYIASCTAMFGMIPASVLMKSMAPFADAAHMMIGPYSGIIALLAFIKASGTLCGWVLLTAQVGIAAADRGLFPAFLGRVDRGGVPALNLCVMAALMSVVTALTATGTLAEQFSRLIEMSVLLCVATYMFACIAVWRYDGRGGSSFSNERAIALAALLFCAYLVVESGAQMLLVFGAFAACTSVLYVVALRERQAVPKDRNSISPL
ncbi:MAG TPA: amino acid permease [Steroidobacteraceae bacterium]|nr:amino acid permease [Steroidobacteraceae bacterium]